MGKSFFQKIAFKLVFWLIVFSSLLTLLITTIQLYIDYSLELNRMTASIDAATNERLLHLSGLVGSGDTDGIELLLDSFLHQRGIAYAAVFVDDRITWEKGERVDGSSLLSIFPLISQDDQKLPGGSLQLITDTGPLRRDFQKRFTTSLAANGVTVFLVATFVFLMFQFLVTRHLEAIARQIEKNDSKKPLSPIKLDRKERSGDELEKVVSGVNSMASDARDAIESLVRNEQRLLLFFDSTEESILGVEKDGTCSFVNDAALRMFDIVSYGDALGSNVETIFNFVSEGGNCSTSRRSVIFRSIDQAANSQSQLETIYTSTGKKIQVAVRCYPVFKNGIVSGAIVFMKDNSETRRLKQERELLSQAVEQLTAMVLITDDKYQVVFANEVVETLTGYKRAELLGKPLDNFRQKEPQGGVSNRTIESILLAGRQWEGVLSAKSKAGLDLHFYCIIAPVFDDNQKVVNTISVCREISYELSIRQELDNVKKMEVVGRLSSSFAHEFGNPLFGVRSVIKDIVGRVKLRADDQRLMELANSECERMTEMIREFQNLYRESSLVDEQASIWEIVDVVVEDCKPLMENADVVCQVRLNEEAKTVYLSRRKFSVALKEILQNAIESMEGNGGHILISGSGGAGNYKVVIGDAGVGIKPEYKERIFEPFFSTKEQVEGTGLGLSTAYAAIDSLGGTVSFDSELGRGTVFSVTVPVQKNLKPMMV